MKAKLVNENINDVLKPKNMVGKKFYLSNFSLPYPAFVFEIIGMGPAKEYKDHIGTGIGMDPTPDKILFECKVVTNEHLNEGPAFYKLDAGERFIIDAEDMNYYECKELDDEVLAVLDQEIEKLQMKEAYYRKLINES